MTPNQVTVCFAKWLHKKHKLVGSATRKQRNLCAELPNLNYM
jgi:hypothetical protein